MNDATAIASDATLTLADPEATYAFGVRLGRAARAGDLLVLTGGLGAGKTTLTRGIGEGLGVRGAVTSPTFVIARVHPSLTGGPALVHVDAYRLGGAAELDDLDLDADVADSVTVVEWGAGLAEGLSPDRLEIRIDVDPASEVRTATLLAHGSRWDDDALAALTTDPGRPTAVDR